MSPSLSIFGIGVVLGGATVAALRFPAPATPRHADADPIALPAWDWRASATPPHLPADSATAAISAWFALRGPGGGEPGFAVRITSLRALILHLPPQAWRPLIEALSRSGRDDDKRLFSFAFKAWVAQDAPGAARWAAAQGASSIELARAALAAWTTQDPAAAAMWACAISDAATASQLVGPALFALGITDPARALALARSRGAKFRDAVLPVIVESLGRNDPVGTIHLFAPDLWNRGQGFWILNGALQSWIKQDPSAALAWLVAQPRESDRILAHWIQTLGESQRESPRTFANAVIATPGLIARPTVLRHLLFEWSIQKPDEVLAWLNSISDPDLRLNLVTISNNTYRTYNPETSLPMALAMPEGANRTERIAMLLGAWAKINPTATLAWIKEHDMPGLETAVYAAQGALLSEIARDDLQAALKEWRALSDPKARVAAIDSIVMAWGQKDPAAAFQWAEQAREAAGLHHYGANNDLLSRWAQTNPEVALGWVEDWIARHPENMRGHASLYLDALGGPRNEKAPRATTADLYAKIKAPALRSETLTRHVREWLTKDPAGARAWLESHDALNPAEAAALLTAAK